MNFLLLDCRSFPFCLHSFLLFVNFVVVIFYCRCVNYCPRRDFDQKAKSRRKVLTVEIYSQQSVSDNKLTLANEMGTYFIDKIRTIHAKLDKLTSAHAGKKVLKIGHKMCPKFVKKYAWNVTNIS